MRNNEIAMMATLVIWAALLISLSLALSGCTGQRMNPDPRCNTNKTICLEGK